MPTFNKQLLEVEAKDYRPVIVISLLLLGLKYIVLPLLIIAIIAIIVVSVSKAR